ncbi:TPA: hypothetical protein ACTC0R_000207, partial [Neisseria meningitidis]
NQEVFGAKTAENLCLGFGCREGKEFCKGLRLGGSRIAWNRHGRRCADAFGREGGAIGSLEKGNGICGQKKLRVKVGRTVRLSVLLSEQEIGQLCPD